MVAPNSSAEAESPNTVDRGGSRAHPRPPVLVTSAEVLRGAGQRRAQTSRAPVAEYARGHVLIVATEGSGHHQVDFAEVPVLVDAVTHVQPGQAHQFPADQNYRADVIVVAPEACPPDLFDPTRPLPSVPLGPVARVAHALAADLVNEQSRPDRNDDIMVAAAGLLLRYVARIGADSKEQHPRLLDVFLADLEARFRETRNVASYAEAAGTSTKTLARLTTSALGLTPKDVIDRRVALEAQRMLAVDRTPIADVGLSLGFSEATNFTKFFARMTESTPHEFRSQPC